MTAAATSAPTTDPLARIGVIAIGRNEGERLRRCFESLPAGLERVVYVDSASTDGSPELARGRGIEALPLDMSIPFTAARARNAGLRRLRERWPDARFALVIDGDCALAPGFMEAALEELARDPRLAAVCGRRREQHPEASRYNRLADMEWDTPVGEADACGGDALLRLAAVEEAGGYDERLIAGEEPELCARLRARGWRIRRIDHDMTWHDAAMTRFGQWWKRAVRSGHAFAELGTGQRALYRRQLRSTLTWGLAVPLLALASAPATGGAGLLLLLLYPALWCRIVLRRRARGDRAQDAALYATFCVLGKLPELSGVAKYGWSRSRGRRSRLIEYK